MKQNDSKYYFRLIWLFTIGVLVCNCTSQSDKSQSAKPEFEFDERINELVGVKCLTKLEEAVQTSESTGKPIFLMFITHPLSGIRETIHKSYKLQLSYILDDKFAIHFVQKHFIPVVLYLDDDGTLSSTHHELALQIIKKNNGSLIDIKNPTKKKVNQKLQIALTHNNSIPGYCLIKADGEKIGIQYDSNQSLR